MQILLQSILILDKFCNWLMVFVTISRCCLDTLMEQKILCFYRGICIINRICCFSYKSCFIFESLRIISSQISIIIWNFVSFGLPSTSWQTFRRRIKVILMLWINVETTLIRGWKWNKIRSRIFSDLQRWYNVSAWR